MDDSQRRLPPTAMRWPADLRAELEKLAREDDRKFSQYVVHVMRQHVEDLKRKSKKS